jgi:hypothetical protein
MEVLILVLAPKRAASVNAAVGAWLERNAQRQPLRVSALTFEEAIAHFCDVLGLHAPTAGDQTTPEEEERRVPVSELELLRETLREAMVNIQGARHAIRRIPLETQRRLGLAEPPYPSRLNQANRVLQRHGALPLLMG